MNSLRSHRRQALGSSVGVLFALLLANALVPALHAQQSGTAIVFYAQSQVNDELWPVVFQAVRDDLASDSGELPKGLVLDQNPAFLPGKDLTQGIDFANVIQVKLLGRCDVLPQADRPSLRGPLGWVLLVSGEIQPFVFIDCSRIAQVLRPVAAGLDKDGRRNVMAQAIAHVLIHEWIHVATQNRSHGDRGITQAALSVNELIADPRLHLRVIPTH
jgi:hypothetical protein